MPYLTLFSNLLQSFGLVAAVFACMSLTTDWSKAYNHKSRDVLYGLVFGIVACLSVFMGIEVTEGVYVDTRTIILSLAGVFNGPIGACIALIMGTAGRIYLGGTGMMSGIMSMLIAVAAGLFYGTYMRNNRLRVTFTRLASFGFLTSVATFLPWGFLPEATQDKIWQDVAPPLFCVKFIGTLILGGLLLEDHRKRQTRFNLEASEAQAAETAKSKSEFIAVMSHEIRTPLNGIIGFAEVLSTSPLPKQERHYAENIRDAAHTLLKILNDILDISKADSGKMELYLEPTNIRELATSAFELMEMQDQSGNNELILKIAPGMPKLVKADQNRLRQILYNLLSNAIKFTTNGQITLEVLKTPGSENKITFRVIDTGIGIAKDKQAKIFESFVQEDASTSRKFGGTGLGLTIVSHLIDLMDGTLTLDSAPGKGSTFTVTVPFKPIDVVIEDENTEALIPVVPARGAGRILLAEDVVMNQELCRVMLEAKGYSVEIVPNANRALDKIKNIDYDLVLMDVRMPGMSGIEATRHIRTKMKKSAQALPVLAMTANDQAQDAKDCLDAGMNDIIVKPVESADLYQKIAKWIKAPQPQAQEEEDDDNGWDLGEEPSSDPSNTPILNQNMIDQFIEFLGRDEFIKSVEEIRDDFQVRLTNMRANPASTEIFHEEMHVLTGLLGNIGLARVASLCRQFMNESASDIADMDRTKALAETEMVWSEGYTALREHLDS